MTTTDSAKVDRHLSEIADMLLLNGTLVDCPGLICGKMGIAVFFFYYSKFTAVELYEDYAMSLIEEIQSQIHNNTPVDYEKGLSGIAVGMNHLIQNNYLKVEGDIFEDFDRRMYHAVMYYPATDYTLYDGLTGYGQYWLFRYADGHLQSQDILFRILGMVNENVERLNNSEKVDVLQFLHQLKIHVPFSETCRQLIRLLDNGMDNKEIPRLKSSFFHQIISEEKQPVIYDQMAFLNIGVKRTGKMGLFNGYAGIGLYILSALKQNSSWMQIL